ASEVLALSEAERDRLLQLLLERAQAERNTTVIASVPEYGTYHAVRRAGALTQAGAGAVNVLPPHQLVPPAEAVLAHLEAVLQAAAPAAVIVQYAPAQAATALRSHTMTDIAVRHERLVAVKVESQPPGRMTAALLECEPPLPSLVGYGGVQMLDALARGAVGVQPGCSFTELYLAVWGRWESGDDDGARTLHQRMLPYLAYWMQDVSLIVAAEKLIAHRRGLIDTDVCRGPARPLDEHERAMVDRFCEEFAEFLEVR